MFSCIRCVEEEFLRRREAIGAVIDIDMICEHPTEEMKDYYYIGLYDAYNECSVIAKQFTENCQLGK